MLYHCIFTFFMLNYTMLQKPFLCGVRKLNILKNLVLSIILSIALLEVQSNYHTIISYSLQKSIL